MPGGCSAKGWLQADLAETELVKVRAEGSNKAKQKQDRRVGGKEDNCANPHLTECLHQEQGGRQDSGSYPFSCGLLEAAATGS